MKHHDTDRTIIGLLFNPYFLLGLIRIVLGLAMPYCIYMLFKSDEPVFLKIVGCLFLAFAMFGGFISGIPHIRKSWLEWRSYVRSCNEADSNETE